MKKSGILLILYLLIVLVSSSDPGLPTKSDDKLATVIENLVYTAEDFQQFKLG